VLFVSLVVDYLYDSFNRRIERKEDSNGAAAGGERVEISFFDGKNVILDAVDPDGSGAAVTSPAHSYFWGLAVDQLLAQENIHSDGAGGFTSTLDDLYWTLQDRLQSVGDAVNATGTVQIHNDYDAFGNCYQTISTYGIGTIADTDIPRYNYTCQELEPLFAGQLFYGGRWYDTSTGRFLTEDPSEFEGGDVNLYRYVGNDSINLTDPTGLCYSGSIYNSHGIDFGLSQYLPSIPTVSLPTPYFSSYTPAPVITSYPSVSSNSYSDVAQQLGNIPLYAPKNTSQPYIGLLAGDYYPGYSTKATNDLSFEMAKPANQSKNITLTVGSSLPPQAAEAARAVEKIRDPAFEAASTLVQKAYIDPISGMGKAAEQQAQGMANFTQSFADSPLGTAWQLMSNSFNSLVSADIWLPGKADQTAKVMASNDNVAKSQIIGNLVIAMVVNKFLGVDNPQVKGANTAEKAALQGEANVALGTWTKVNETMSTRAAAYQTQIGGRAGQAYVVNGVKFDAQVGGALLEAKGPGYAWAVENGKFINGYKGAAELVDQANRQIAASRGAPITWHVAENKTTTAIKNLFKKNNITQINVVHTPVKK
jgi:RHS repeat-associated protein